MWSPAELANVPKFASGCLVVTFSIIPEVAWVRFPPHQVRGIPLLCFLLGGGTAFTSTMSLKMMSLEVTKFAKFVKRYIIDRADMFPDGPVEVEDLQMSAGVH